MDRDPYALGRKSQEKDTVIGNWQCEEDREISGDAVRSSPETPRGGPVEQLKHPCGTDDLKQRQDSRSRRQPSLQMNRVTEE